MGGRNCNIGRVRGRISSFWQCIWLDTLFLSLSVFLFREQDNFFVSIYIVRELDRGLRPRTLDGTVWRGVLVGGHHVDLLH